MSDCSISAITINSSGDWMALGAGDRGQLIVWEWQSETYIMKQQGHHNNLAVVTYSPNGLYMVTGGDDGKVSKGHHNSVKCFCL